MISGSVSRRVGEAGRRQSQARRRTTAARSTTAALTTRRLSASSAHATAPALLLLQLLLVGCFSQAGANWFGGGGGWRQGRATRYDGPDDWWSIHEGSCGFGYLDQGVASGWDVAAISDTCDDYSGSCGRCYEVKCDPASFNDGYGQWLDRSNVCRDPDRSVIVQVVDSCPCNYPTNAYSNRRWCCGDMYHLDLSTWAFEKLAEKKWGVIGLLVRQVDCGQGPSDPAPPPPDPTPFVSRISRPWGWRDRRPWRR
ncbi:hypothetical protein CHLRE_17g723100v5 [Chlamydomonas reinhardtii]|uniref:Expansin-like EG45 domain-containing protein n=1 Tax=Chlamydomonas reinhardtii TaxID=3055 RepID=A0A2K3CQH0_CHLRE|nr:uncharacterized protein CHLRE_17g723100v5 [Chlamydomonas reinhardtii]PNW70515.1 hypothetical protein CHLRE_17g723100v5 [Chlamydomonas reinhardtii]